jgi:hypothetical protein
MGIIKCDGIFLNMNVMAFSVESRVWRKNSNKHIFLQLGHFHDIVHDNMTIFVIEVSTFNAKP